MHARNGLFLPILPLLFLCATSCCLAHSHGSSPAHNTSSQMFTVAAMQPLKGSPKCSLAHMGCYYSGGSGTLWSAITCALGRSSPVTLLTPGKMPGCRFTATSSHELVSFVGLCRWSRSLTHDGVTPTQPTVCRSLECVTNGNFATMEPVCRHSHLCPCRLVEW